MRSFLPPATLLLFHERNPTLTKDGPTKPEKSKDSEPFCQPNCPVASEPSTSVSRPILLRAPTLINGLNTGQVAHHLLLLPPNPLFASASRQRP